MRWAIATCLLAAACSGSGVKTTSASPTSASPAATSASARDEPTAEEQPKLYDALQAIRPGFVANVDRMVRNAVSVCERIKEASGESVDEYAAGRFEGGSAENVTPAEGAQIVAAVKGTFCES